MTNPEMSMLELITQSESEIIELQRKLDRLQERHNLLFTVAEMRESILAQVGRAIEILTTVSPDQIANFKSELDAKFEAAAWRSEWDASKVGEIVLFEPNPAEVITLPKSPVKTNSKPDKALAKIFGNRVKQQRQFLIIQKELEAIGVKFGKLISSQDDVKGWQLEWHGDKAGLFWTVGGDWSVEALEPGAELTGQWEDFTLEQQLECNNVDLDADTEDEEGVEIIRHSPSASMMEQCKCSDCKPA